MKTSLVFLLATFLPTQASAIAGDLTATYTVPVAQPMLASFASFSLDAVDQQPTQADQEKISFTLPDDLTGAAGTTIELSGPVPQESGFTMLTGPLVDASCVQQNHRNLCLMHYKPSWGAAWPQNASTYLANKYASDAHLQSRIAVAQQFASDPAGVISFPAL